MKGLRSYIDMTMSTWQTSRPVSGSVRWSNIKFRVFPVSKKYKRKLLIPFFVDEIENQLN